jgi:hypothetical protein
MPPSIHIVDGILPVLTLIAVSAFLMSNTLQRMLNFIMTINSRTDEVSNRLSALESRVAQLELFQSTPQVDTTVVDNMLTQVGQ